MNDKEKREKQVTNFAPNLRKYRQESPYTMKEIAEMLDGLPYPTYRNYENGKAEAPYFILCKLADIFNITVDELIGHPASEFNRMKEFYRNAGYDVKEGTDGKITVVQADNTAGQSSADSTVYSNTDGFIKDALTAYNEFIKVTTATAANIIGISIFKNNLSIQGIAEQVAKAKNGIGWADDFKLIIDNFCEHLTVSSNEKGDSSLINAIIEFLINKHIESDEYQGIFIYVMNRKGYPQKWGKFTDYQWLIFSSHFTVKALGKAGFLKTETRNKK